ncbi:hypothetical protein O2K51_00695 [Apibacter raozihei]|uniref:hypothetical protein n=1 Tax=Apibacter raozihei TaxID=2500547 RepID=UPI000FE3403F|nr:hypothetical protein [Apibacter raozihei]
MEVNFKETLEKIKHRNQVVSSSSGWIVKEKKSNLKFEGVNKPLLLRLSHTLTLLSRYDKGE